MIPLIVKILTGGLADKVLNGFDNWQKNKLSRDQIAKELEGLLSAHAAEVAETQASVIIAEARGESWIQRAWRPITALLMVFIVFWFGWIQPMLVGWFALPPLKVGDPLLMEILAIVKLCLGGYIGGRTLEKVFKR